MTPTPTPCILSTGNIMSTASEVLRNSTRSSTEFIASLRTHLRASPLSPPPSPPLPSATRAPIYIPQPPSPESLNEPRDSYDVTVKLFHVASAPKTSRDSYTRDAVKRVLTTLRIPHIDLLILSLPGIHFDAEDTCGAASELEVQLWTETYRTLESLQEAGVIKRIGIAEFGPARLSQLLKHVKIKPSVNQINVRDCCVVPKPLILFAKEQGIELLTHNDYADILPAETLKNVLVDEFGLIEAGKELSPQWVVKYTAVVRSRGVVENKGYIALADIV